METKEISPMMGSDMNEVFHANKLLEWVFSMEMKGNVKICNPWTWDWVLESMLFFAEWLWGFFVLNFVESLNSEGRWFIACKKGKLIWTNKTTHTNAMIHMMDCQSFVAIMLPVLWTHYAISLGNYVILVYRHCTDNFDVRIISILERCQLFAHISPNRNAFYVVFAA